MKEDYHIDRLLFAERAEAKALFESLNIPVYSEGFSCLFASNTNDDIPCKKITLPELRELARPKEYLNEKFELVVTNQPKEGWLLVPDNKSSYIQDCNHKCWRVVSTINPPSWIKILWQRNPKESEMNTEKKGRFLHQWAYEAFGRGEDVQRFEFSNNWVSLDHRTMMDIFDIPDSQFRIKPKNITIGSKTINAPISVKPENGTMYYIPLLSVSKKYEERQWHDNAWDNIMIDRNMIHLNANDAINHADAILELMKEAK